MNTPNPFAAPQYGPAAQTTAAADRIALVREFDAAQCRAALLVPYLQKTVETAIHRRLRQLEKAQ